MGLIVSYPKEVSSKNYLLVGLSHNNTIVYDECATLDFETIKIKYDAYNLKQLSIYDLIQKKFLTPLELLELKEKWEREKETEGKEG